MKISAALGKISYFYTCTFFLLFFVLNSTLQSNAEVVTIRTGHFPNVTHAPALIGRSSGQFEDEFAAEAKIKWITFNTGPEAIEALFANEIDILYVGPNPAVNGFVRSEGKALRVISGVASGGSAFVVRNDSNIAKFEDIRGKRVAAPQKGNTQDVALQHLMGEKGLRSRARGGDVDVFYLAGGDQINAILKKQVDAIWTVEPMVSRLVAEANGKILFEEKSLWPDGKYATTLLVARKKFIDEHPDIVEKWVRVHLQIIVWIQKNSGKAKERVNAELKRETGKPLPPDYLNQSFERVRFTGEPMRESVLKSADSAFQMGYLGKTKMDLSGLYDLSFLESVKEK